MDESVSLAFAASSIFNSFLSDAHDTITIFIYSLFTIFLHFCVQGSFRMPIFHFGTH